MTVALFDRTIGELRCRVVASERDDGDVHPIRVEPDELEYRQVAIAGRRWAMLDQVHGVDVHRVGHAGHAEGEPDTWPVSARGDVIVLGTRGRGSEGPCAAIWAADCAAIMLFGAGGTIVAAHGGWRGLAAGVIDVAVGALIEVDGAVTAAVVGPLIHPCCYEFGADDLDAVANGVHAQSSEISSVASTGVLALDVPTAVRRGLAHRGVDPVVVGPCTGCDSRWFSHRIRNDTSRHAVVAWVEHIRTASMAG
jgi:copper oxidase (laccase) domain-containing protein